MSFVVVWRAAHTMRAMRVRALTRYTAVVAVVTALFCASAAGASGGPYVPSANVPPVPNFLATVTCTETGSGTYTCPSPCFDSAGNWPVNYNHLACSAWLARAITHARALEHVAPLVLPSNWTSLTLPEQLFVVLDLERSARGYPPYVGLNTDLSAQAQSAAQRPGDPMFVAGPAWVPGSFGGAWGAGSDPLEADYTWMYDDGWSGSAATTWNRACTSANAPACWGHREELLGSDPDYNPGVGLDCTNCEVGAGAAVLSGDIGSYALLIQRPAGAAPATYFTWAQEQPYLSSTSPSPTTTTPPSTTYPSRVVLGGHHLSATRASVVWGVSGARTGLIALSVYAVAGCRREVAHGVAHVGASGWGVLSARGHFARGHYYAQVATPHAISACVALGVASRSAWRAHAPTGF